MSCETPTLLHLAAKYALWQLCDKLLDLPDSQHACVLRNVDGRTPHQLAAANGHDELASRLSPQKVSLSAATDLTIINVVTGSC